MSEEKLEVDVLEIEKPNTAILVIQAQMATAYVEGKDEVKWSPSGAESRSFTVQLQEKDKEKAFEELQKKIQESISSWDIIKSFPKDEPVPENLPELEAYRVGQEKTKPEK